MTKHAVRAEQTRVAVSECNGQDTLGVGVDSTLWFWQALSSALYHRTLFRIFSAVLAFWPEYLTFSKRCCCCCSNELQVYPFGTTARGPNRVLALRPFHVVRAFGRTG